MIVTQKYLDKKGHFGEAEMKRYLILVLLLLKNENIPYQLSARIIQTLHTHVHTDDDQASL